VLKDRMIILDLVEEGKISVAEAVEIIEAIAITDENETMSEKETRQPEIILHFHID
jgi:predicted HTH domain antitoxin